MIRAVCFDLGGVVAQISYRWAEMLSRCELPVPSHIGPDDELHAMPQFDAYQAGDLTDAEYITALAKYLQVSEDEAMRVHCGMLIRPYPGILEIVEELSRREIIAGCLSNTNAPHWEVLNGSRFPAVQAMRVRVASFEIDASKPDERAFRAFERASGCAGDEILLFDDSVSNCLAARQLNWHAVQVDPQANPASQIEQRLRLERWQA